MTNVDWALKIAALLHDPIIKVLNIPKHEDIANKTARELFGDEVASRLGADEIKNADRISSSIDRMPLSIAQAGEYIGDYLRCERIKVKNPIWPEFEYNPAIPENWKQLHSGFKMNLKRRISGIKELKDRYFALFVLYEKLFLESGLPLLPADTRVPTYSIFDHVYAATSALNLVNGGRLVLLDIPSTQQFIGSSRKLRDLWVSSYLVSAMMWYTVLQDILEFGPDVLIMPSPRLNPFLAFSVRMHFSWSATFERDLREIESGEIYGSKPSIYYHLDMPVYPVIPGKATLIIPRGSDRDEDFYQNRLEEGWHRVWEAVERLAEIKRESSLTWSFIYRILEHYNRSWAEAKFHSIPPLGLRVVVKDFEAEDWRSYDRAVRCAGNDMRRKGKARESRESELFLEELTSKPGLGAPIPSGRGYDYCTVCGRLPALVITPRDEAVGDLDAYSIAVYLFAEEGKEPEEIEEIMKNGRISEEQIRKIKEKSKEIEELKAIFKPGERLCPWCFIKRVLSLEPRILKVLLSDLKVDQVVEEIAEIAKISDIRMFPSVAHISVACFLSKLEESPLKEEISCAQSLGSIDFWEFRLRKVRELDEMKKKLLYCDPEDWIFNTDYGKNRNVWRYYSLLMADVDNMGRLISGDLFAVAPAEPIDRWETVKRYLKSSAEGPLREVLDCIFDVVDGKKEVDEELLRKFMDGKLSRTDAQRRLRKVIEILKEIKGAGRGRSENGECDEEKGIVKLPLTLSYHATISAMLMRNAMRDIAKINDLDGFVVYAGGDDLLAVLPLHSAFRAVRDTRRGLAGLDGEVPGFTDVRGVLYPMLIGPGRSYAVAVAHYRHPLFEVLSSLREAIEEAKERTGFSSKDRILLKDVLVALRIPGGERATFPISTERIIFASRKDYAKHVARTVELADDIMRSVGWKCPKGNGEYSHSLIYDFLERSGILRETSGELHINIVRKLIADNYKGRGPGPLLENVLFLGPALEGRLALKGNGKWEDADSLIASVFRSVKVLGGGMH